MAKKRKSSKGSVETVAVDDEAVAEARKRLAAEGFGVGQAREMWKEHEVPSSSGVARKRKAVPAKQTAAAAPVLATASMTFNFAGADPAPSVEPDTQEEDDEPQAAAAAQQKDEDDDEDNDSDGSEEEEEEEEEEEDDDDAEDEASEGTSADGLTAARVAQLCGDLCRSVEDSGVLDAAAALPDAAGMAAATLDSDGDALLDTTAEASVRTLSVLHRATQLYSAAVCESGAGAAALPGELDDTRFLKGLRLGAADKEAVTQYVEMGLWRRIAWLNQLAHSAVEDVTASDGDAPDQTGDAGDESAGAAATGQPSASFSFKQWYQEEYTAMLGDELDALLQEAGFSARDVSALIGCIANGSEILGSLDKTLSATRIRSPGEDVSR
eukprot:COSAG02_NODE_3822_length_6184_cov_537.928219_2_plen_383_part_00